jgi:hypothetical protein
MLVDAAVFALACAVLVSMPQQAERPQHSLESVALSTSLEDLALAASLQPDLVLLACESAAGEISLKEKLSEAAGAFPQTAFLVHCPSGKTFSLSNTGLAASAPAPTAESIFTNRVIVPRDGNAVLLTFEAQRKG